MRFDVIDDEEIIRELMSELISSEGYEAKTFVNAADYVDYFSSPDYEPPIAIFSDLRMPGMDGIGLVRYIREHLPLQRLVMVSGNPEAATVVDDHLCEIVSKPFHPRKVIGQLKSLHECKRVLESDSGESCTDHCRFGIDHACPLAKQN